ncbi:PREDICTED: uncharacterized protein LOC106121138 [Papilio xuthus]|uniref:Uncharacterized protein LOC106121138 n=1 Tax=Papilio xuthus TaxID=66420 RepID=A0AAJ7ECR4_PAPXU|nr:PREDICTED: uncharacterized protein LOC106121138 [Papilio xuthus]
MDRYVVTNDCIPEIVHHSKINENSAQFFRRKNFLNGLQNALNILNGLERCLQKTGKYEKKLLKCKSSHSHTHNNDWWESEPSEGKETKISNTDKTTSSRNQVDLAESWSTMSIVCLQYQYEELSKRYEALLQAYDERCSALSERERAVTRLQGRTDRMRAQLVHAHQALLSVGDKYLMLRGKKMMQKKWYEERLEALKRLLQEITFEAERAEFELNSQTQESVESEDVDTSLLVSEISRCNSLFLENLRLKTDLECVSTQHNDTY